MRFGDLAIEYLAKLHLEDLSMKRSAKLLLFRIALRKKLLPSMLLRGNKIEHYFYYRGHGIIKVAIKGLQEFEF